MTRPAWSPPLRSANRVRPQAGTGLAGSLSPGAEVRHGHVGEPGALARDAFFKSLSGQFARVRAGKPFLVFGDGRLTTCKPIADDDLADYLVDCLDDARLHNRVLPIGGPGDAIAPLQQGALLFEALGRTPRFKHVPVALGEHAVF